MMRKVVVEHNIISVDGRHVKSCVMSGDQFEFDDLCEGRGCTWEHEGFSDVINKKVTFNQTFLVTDLTDEELLRIFI
jgi:hypothetical protein